jgi:PKHD-type hydroxylase
MSYKYDYWSFGNVLNQQEIFEINNFIDKNFHAFEPSSHSAKDLEGNIKKTSTVKQIDYYKVKHLLHNIVDKIINVTEMEFGYIIYGLKNNDVILLNEYSSDNLGKYDWHIDTSQSNLHETKMTALINVSTELYEGGKFEIFNTNQYEVKELNKPGNLIMFKSFLNHRVLPITKGKRRTLTIFLHGPKFR